MKKRSVSILILLGYSIPWVFLGMYGDFTLFRMWPYFLGAGVMAVLGLYCGKTKRIPLALLGNLLSLFASCLCTYAFATEHWSYFFKTFPPVIRTIQFSGIYLALQLIPWWLKKICE